MKSEAFLLGIMDKSAEKQCGILFLYMMTASRIVCVCQILEIKRNTNSGRMDFEIG